MNQQKIYYTFIKMDDNTERNQPSKEPWWRDRAIVVGIIGVIATIAVGWVTYWLTAGTESREYQERVKAARNEILTGVSRSIGEGKVPNKAKIQAVINSVERQYRIKQEDSEKPELIIDDIIERVLANEFLDAQKREELSSKLLAMRDEQVAAATESQKKQQTNQPNPESELMSSIAFRIALLTATITAVFAAFTVIKVRTRDFGRELVLPLATILTAATILLGLLAILYRTPAAQNFFKSLQK